MKTLTSSGNGIARPVNEFYLSLEKKFEESLLVTLYLKTGDCFTISLQASSPDSENFYAKTDGEYFHVDMVAEQLRVIEYKNSSVAPVNYTYISDRETTVTPDSLLQQSCT